MATTDDLDLIRSLLSQPGPSAEVVERGRSRLAELSSTELTTTGLSATGLSGTGLFGSWRPNRSGNRAGGQRRTLARWSVAVGTGLVATGTAAAILVAMFAPGASGRKPAGPASRAAVAQPGLRTARQILLTAASHVGSAAPASGKYWQVAVVSGQVLVGGTKAHPFDIITSDPWSKWYARVVGKREWAIGRPPTTAHPMTAADWAAWRAAGSPRAWRLGWTWQGNRFVPNSKGLTMAPGPVETVWRRSNGVVGYIGEGQPGLTAVQFAALPSGTARLRAYLFRKARRLARPGPASSGGIPVSYVVWDEGTGLLTDPVSPQVRAATFRVLADLPRVHSLGLTRDPLHRLGYALRSGSKVIVVDPATGRLLAYEFSRLVLGHRPGETLCKVHGSYEVIQAKLPRVGGASKNCVYYPGYYGRAYDGPLSEYSAIVAVGWVNSLPPLPPATKANHGSGPF